MKLFIFTLIVIVNATFVNAKDNSPYIKFFENKQAGTKNLPFSEAVRVGNLLFLSGQLGVDTKTGKLVKGGLKAEAKQTMDNIKQTLETYGYSMKDVVKCTVMLADISEWQTFNEIYVTYFSKPYPARSAFGANGLGLNAQLEVECIAAKADDKRMGRFRLLSE